jgi:16S rRNA (guanine527-N7)-methyltransferase
MSESSEAFASKLNSLLRQAGLGSLNPERAARFQDLLSLLQRWNARINLTAIRDEDGILSRHFVESIACSRALPAGIETVLDFGSGAGFPGIPIALCRSEISVTLAESQGKKAAFLQEAVRVLGISAKVHSGRAESLPALFDCVVIRAVDRMPLAVEAAAKLVAPGGWLALMTTAAELPGLQAVAGSTLSWEPAVSQPGGEDRVIALARQGVSSPA